MPKCKICKVKFEPQANWQSLNGVCSVDCGYKLSQIKKEKQEKKEINQIKESLKTKSDYEKILQILINQIVRLIDKDCPCIATGSFNGKMNAGHRASVGSNPTIRFHLDNIHIQSEHSNSFKGGDTLKYNDGLIITYGKDYYEYVDSLRKFPPIKLSIEDLKEKIKIAREIVKELKEKNCIYSTDERLKMRAYYNEQLGIYK